MVPPSPPHRIHLPCVKLTPGSRLQIISPHAISCSPLSGASFGQLLYQLEAPENPY